MSSLSPWRRMVRHEDITDGEELLSQHQVLGRIVPLLQLLQVNVFNFPSKSKNMVTKTSLTIDVFFITSVSNLPCHTWRRRAPWWRGWRRGTWGCRHGPATGSPGRTCAKSSVSAHLLICRLTSRPGCRPGRGSCRGGRAPRLPPQTHPSTPALLSYTTFYFSAIFMGTKCAVIQAP